MGPHIRPTPKNANVACPLQASSPGPNSTREPSSQALLISSTSPWVSPRSLATRGPAHGHSRNGCQRHSADVSDPFPSAAFNLERDGLHTCSFMEFRVGDFVWPVWPVDSQYLPEALVLKNFQHLTYAFGDLP